MDITILRAEIHDLTSVRNVLHKAHKENRQAGYFFPASIISRRALYKKLKRDRYYILKYNGRIAGTIALKLKKGHAEIGSLAILPKYRHRGLGSKLLNYAERKAASWGMNRVVLVTLKKHPTLPAYYRSHGYHRVKAFKSNKWVKLQKKLWNI